MFHLSGCRQCVALFLQCIVPVHCLYCLQHMILDSCQMKTYQLRNPNGQINMKCHLLKGLSVCDCFIDLLCSDWQKCLRDFIGSMHLICGNKWIYTAEMTFFQANPKKAYESHEWDNPPDTYFIFRSVCLKISKLTAPQRCRGLVCSLIIGVHKHLLWVSSTCCLCKQLTCGLTAWLITSSQIHYLLVVE